MSRFKIFRCLETFNYNYRMVKDVIIPCILENLENNKFIFQVLEMSSNFTKSGNELEKILPVKNPLGTKSL